MYRFFCIVLSYVDARNMMGRTSMQGFIPVFRKKKKHIYPQPILIRNALGHPLEAEYEL